MRRGFPAVNPSSARSKSAQLHGKSPDVKGPSTAALAQPPACGPRSLTPEYVRITAEDNVVRAAKLIFWADSLLIAAGAGFSADSGLPVFKDIADVAAYHTMGVSYADLCDPSWLRKDSEIFFGFWGNCFNDYMSAVLHNGYMIVKRWHDDFFSKGSGPGRGLKATEQHDKVTARGTAPARPSTAAASSRIPGKTLHRSKQPRPTNIKLGQPAGPTQTASDTAAALNSSETGAENPSCLSSPSRKGSGMFVFTSNVDMAFERSGIPANMVYEIHGNVVRWQCAVPCCHRIWPLPSTYRFYVDKCTMRAPRFCSTEARPAHASTVSASVTTEMSALAINSGAPMSPHRSMAETETADIPASMPAESTDRWVGGAGARAARLLQGHLTPYDCGRGANLGPSRRVNHPRCQFCGAQARPNVLMFEDDAWISDGQIDLAAAAAAAVNSRGGSNPTGLSASTAAAASPALHHIPPDGASGGEGVAGSSSQGEGGGAAPPPAPPLGASPPGGEAAFKRWLRTAGKGRLVVLEGGCGRRVPTVRRQSHKLLAAGAALIRINASPRDAQVPPAAAAAASAAAAFPSPSSSSSGAPGRAATCGGGPRASFGGGGGGGGHAISLQMGVKEALESLDEVLRRMLFTPPPL